VVEKGWTDGRVSVQAKADVQSAVETAEGGYRLVSTGS
jgi:hypothetical protein